MTKEKEIKKEKEKIDPYFSPLKFAFESEFEKVFKRRPYLQRGECLKILELAQDINDFETVLPDAMKKLKSLKFGDLNFKPSASWLLKDNNFSRLMNGEFDDMGDDDDIMKGIIR